MIRLRLPAVVVAIALLTAAASADELHLTDGRSFKGKVIRQTEVLIQFEVTEPAPRKLSFPMSRVEKVVRGDAAVDGDDDDRPESGDTTPGHDTEDVEGGEDASPPDEDTRPATRSRAEVEALIQKIGRTPPDWWDQTKLDYPKSLDLSWPRKPPGGWDANRNVGQYLWSTINPNENRWHSGAKLMTHLMTVNKNDKDVVRRAMGSLAHIYGDLLEDHARAAFWLLQAAKLDPLNTNEAAKLAECYYRLGSKALAVETLNRQQRFSGATIKLWSEMGDQARALGLCKKLESSQPDWAYLLAGDVCRRYGDIDQAIRFYEGVVSMKKGSRAIDRNKQRARASLEATKLFDGLDLKKVPDGTYSASSLAYAGQLHVEVTVKAGRIEGVKVTRHQEKQYYSSISETTRQIVSKQSVKGIDTTTGATITSEAIINATAKALSGGMK